MEISGHLHAPVVLPPGTEYNWLLHVKEPARVGNEEELCQHVAMKLERKCGEKKIGEETKKTAKICIHHYKQGFLQEQWFCYSVCD
jgi:hypothetical protein